MNESPHIIFQPETLAQAAEEEDLHAAELEAIEKLVKRAKLSDVLVECIAWYVDERLRGALPREAAADTIYEWDC